MRPGAGDERDGRFWRPGIRPGGLGEARGCGLWPGPSCSCRSTAGSNADTIGRCAEAGADLFVIGSALFSQDDYRQAMTEFTALAKANYRAN